MSIAETQWHNQRHLLITRLQGRVTVADVQQWQSSLAQALAGLADETRFKLIADLFGYEYGELAAHKAMRTVVPLMLAAHGFRTALFDLFDPVDVPIRRERGLHCVAVAHVHHDESKMAEYDARLGSAHERWLPSYAAAESWIELLPLPAERS